MEATERYEAWNEFVHGRLTNGPDETIPHCDSRILHHPNECRYCNRPDWQDERKRLGIALTGRDPDDGQVPCEADAERPPGAPNDHRHWGGNKPTSSIGDPSYPRETVDSQFLYGDLGGRA
jgi:hypothetical protein